MEQPIIETTWNPDQACKEMAALFAEADRIMQQPHYQEQVSADELETPSADSLPQTEQTNR